MECCGVGVLAFEGADLCCFAGHTNEATTSVVPRRSLADRLVGEGATIDRIDLLTAAGAHAWLVARLRHHQVAA